MMEELLFLKKINLEKIRLQKKQLELLKRNYAILINQENDIREAISLLNSEIIHCLDKNQEIAERIDSMNLEKIQKYEYEQADKG